VQRRQVRGVATAVHLAAHAPGVARDDVGACVDVAAVDALDRVRGANQRPRAPQRLLVGALGGRHLAAELGAHGAVEDHAALLREQVLDAGVGARVLGDRHRYILPC
jgi:hypothetical protein